MASKKLPPTLLFRSAFCINFVKSTTGLTTSKIEELIRINQYKKFGLRPPATETVLDYFKLRRNIAFDPMVKTPKTPPWLLALDREIPGAAYHYFHPLIDLIWGRLESGVFWMNKAQTIPQEWIEDEQLKGNKDLAEDWLKQNAATAKRRKRSLKSPPIDQLSFVHLTLLRIPVIGEGMLFHKPGLSEGWVRRYGPIDEELSALDSQPGLDSLAAKIGLMLEAAEIGDSKRFKAAKLSASEASEHIASFPQCSRVAERLKELTKIFLTNQLRRNYTHTNRYGFGWPSSWWLQFDARWEPESVVSPTSAVFENILPVATGRHAAT